MNQDRKDTLSVMIYGEEYKIVADSDVNHLRLVAGHVDDVMKQISEFYPRLDAKKVAVLTAINITDEYYKLQKEYNELLELLEND